jgi:hypothetical protein
MDAHAISLTVLHIGQMNDAIDNSPPYFRNLILQALSLRIASMNALEVTSVCIGLGASGFAWDDLPRSLQW